jgi:hypothetical protein
LGWNRDVRGPCGLRLLGPSSPFDDLELEEASRQDREQEQPDHPEGDETDT